MGKYMCDRVFQRLVYICDNVLSVDNHAQFIK